MPILKSQTFELNGFVVGDADISTVMVNGQAAAITGRGKNISFSSQLSFSAGQELSVEIVVSDSTGESTTLSFTVYRDDGSPTVSLNDDAILAAPEVNSVTETPFTLSGEVSDRNLSGFSVNGNAIGLLPITQKRYTFSVDLQLAKGQESLFTLKTWDKAGNSTTKEILFRLDSSLYIDIISPQPGTEIYTEDGNVEIDIALSIPGLQQNDNVIVDIDGETIDDLTRASTDIHGLVNRNLADGDHTLSVSVQSDAGALLARTSRSFTVVDVRLIPLELTRQDPANNSSGAKNNGFIGFYFNRTIDPTLLTVDVLETYHGEGYQKPPQGANLTTLSNVEMVEIHRDREVVGGSLAHFPAKTMVAFYPQRNFAFGATVFVTLTYDGVELANTTFAVKEIPTFIQGFIGDQFGDPIEGIEVDIPELDRSSITDKEGSFTFGFGDTDESRLPPGRYKAIANPGLGSNRFGSMEFFIQVEKGRLNELGVNTIAVLDTTEPFRYLQSSGPDAVLAGGELTLTLADASLEFSENSGSGSVHTQFLSVNEQPYAFMPSAAPQWVFNLNPGGIKVSGNLGVKIQMPAMIGSYEYIDHIGERVVLVGLDDQTLQIVPVGVGKVNADTHMVTSEGETYFNRLDIIGYSFVAEESQQLLGDYSNGSITFNQLINNLNK